MPIFFYGVYRKQVIKGILKADALVMKNMHIFDDISDLHPDAYDLNPDTLRITVVNASRSVISDNNADFSVMDNHESRPEIYMAAEVRRREAEPAGRRPWIKICSTMRSGWITDGS